MTRSFSICALRWLTLTGTSLTGLLSGCVQYVAFPVTSYAIKPDFEEQTGRSVLEDDPVVTVVCRTSSRIQADHPNIHTDVMRYVSNSMAMNNISMTEPSVIQSWIDQHPDYDEVSEIGQFFEADYVIEIHIEGFGLYEENSVELLRGRTEAYVTVYEMLDDGSGDRIYETEIDFAFPTRFPRSTSDTPYSQFKMEYLTALSDKITWLFVPRETGSRNHCAM